jgi:sugar phosphate isomerase/epimerase
MVPGPTLTEKAQNLRSWGYDAIAVFQPYNEWSDELREELASLEYGPPDPMPLFDPYQQLSQDQEDDFTAFYRQVLDLVAGTPARVLLEPINRYESRYLNRIVDNLRIIDALAHPNAPP